MSVSQIYIAVSIVVLGIIALLLFFVNKNRGERRLTPLTSLAFGFVVAGTLFGENRLIGFGLMGAGVVLAIIDLLGRSRKT